MQENSNKLISKYEEMLTYEFSYDIISARVLPDCETFALGYALCADVDGLDDPRTIQDMTHSTVAEPCTEKDLEPGLAGLERRNVLCKIGDSYFFNSPQYWAIPSLA
jgi:hypothetical protein